MNNCKVLAHRGASAYAPENTMEAFRLAVEQGADGFEIDINLSKDGEIVVIHDDSIDRTSDGQGDITSYTLEELKAFNFNKGFAEQYTTARIPTLREVLGLVKEHGLYLNIEVKDILSKMELYAGLPGAAAELVREYGLTDQVIFSSFNHYSMVKLKNEYPEMKTGLLYIAGLYQGAEYARLTRADALHPVFFGVNREAVDEARAAGVQVNAWTVNEPEHIGWMLAAGVDAIITDRPDVCIGLRG
ncbi:MULTISPECIES: glycerophosphodiester phosphodiesterase [unclassified Paenibacillus]|uniref:glycerophosphodiester phosphodiesterase n=1 Tax=unclassified Paenibacillus TaxID=185978 RepID=UPI002405D63D|nr:MULTISPECIES: glycerophosphodiester phosphodiesterase [unclassified Paenibacillus]MDF9841460.1 glycerophosphoryl diester phosphodiesterase [Paenibacillus sp. PastF-2]MDF9848050.1 glycerophosphoryl diester phosphodiesterase [Paenibacillus sp. PastM-2]MDF9854619.1 glycerophosphoryl diester phosphodiesterase [Paenibacillus sp. PastF-1]MDH6479773.1 glycerophosphoryl diester phosphodiesterase [Paenibacillus sp. PastH-2]MDH6507325.1 glycerophosphoryl diester phosphodiesterase [Paenibacillus sp. P